MCKHTVELDKPQRTVLMHIACWITKAINTCLEYVMLMALPLQQ